MNEYGNGYEFYKYSDPPQLLDSRTANLDLKADAVWQMGSMNEVKFGASYKQHWLNLYDIYDPKRNFPYVDDYNTEPFEGAAYIQDKIELPYLIINIGLRYDYLNANVIFRSDPLDPNSLITVESTITVFSTDLVLHILFRIEQNFIFLTDTFFRILILNLCLKTINTILM